MSTDRTHSHVTGAAKRSRPLAISTPMGVSAVAVLAVVLIALVATALLLGPRGLFGIGAASPSPTPAPQTSATEPTPTLNPTAEPTAEPTPRLTATPVATPEPAPTAVPTPTPAPVWTGIEWSEGAVVSGTEGTPPYLRADDAFWLVGDAIFWNTSWVGVGWGGRATDIGAAFFTSDDGLHWVVSDWDGQSGRPDDVVATRSGLIALSTLEGQIGLWASSDGRSWEVVDSASWRAAWAEVGDGVAAVAGGDAGIVVISDHGCRPVIRHSPDGVVWSTIELGAEFDGAIISSLAAFSGGFVATGTDGLTDCSSTSLPWAGRPAAWLSHDGLSWSAADVEGEVVPGGRLRNLLVGADGMTADGTGAPGLPDWPPPRWASADGLIWRVTGPIGWEPIGTRAVGSDGSRMVALTVDSESQDLFGWVSIDGVEWTPLEMTGATASVEEWFDPYFSPLWVGPDGVIVAGGGGYYNPTQYWFGSADGP